MAQSEDLKWINMNYSALQAKYPNMDVAVKDGEVISANKEYGKVYQEARANAADFVTDSILLASLLSFPTSRSISRFSVGCFNSKFEQPHEHGAFPESS